MHHWFWLVAACATAPPQQLANVTPTSTPAPTYTLYDVEFAMHVPGDGYLESDLGAGFESLHWQWRDGHFAVEVGDACPGEDIVYREDEIRCCRGTRGASVAIKTDARSAAHVAHLRQVCGSLDRIRRIPRD